MNKLKVGTVFSGIGAIEHALKKKGIDYEVVFACDNGERELPLTKEEIGDLIKNKDDNEKQNIIKKLYDQTGKENLVKKSYFANYGSKEEIWYEDIRFLSGTKYKNKIDLLVGGSPCQSFSVNGKRAGLQDVRGTLFYEFARLITEIKPKVFIYENVKGMLTHDNGNTWEVIKSVFNSLGYFIAIKKDDKGNESPILNSKNYGIPQSRDRIFVVGFKNKKYHDKYEFPKTIKLIKTVKDFLDEDVDSKYYLGKKGFEFVTTHPSRAQVSEDIMRCQKANQQFNWNGDFIFVPLEKVANNLEIMNRAYVSTFKNEKGVIRKFTPRECLRLMGFNDSFKIVVNDTVMYRQAGNSIVVEVLVKLVEKIIETGVWDES